MRYEDASQTGSISSEVTARDDTEHLAGNDFGPATGNIISGSGTVSGSTGTDMAGAGAHITAIAGAGGSDTSFDSSGRLEVAGQYGTLTIDAEGNYTYTRNPGSPEGVSDTFTYTLADAAGATDDAKLVIAIGNPPILQAQGTQTIQTNNGVVVLPAGVELSDVRVVGRDLVVTLPDGSTMVIPDGAIFVPQLVVNGVEVPASNLAALLIDSEPKPAAGDLSPQQQSSGGNFGLPPGPLDPGVPLGDLLPPTELNYTPPEFEDPGEIFEDNEPIAGVASVALDDDVIPGKGGNAGGTGDNPPDAPEDNVVTGFLPGSDGDGSLTWALLESGAPAGFTYDLQPDGSLLVIQTQDGSPVTVLTIEVNEDTGAFEVTQNNPIRHATGADENNVDFVISYTVTDQDGDFATGALNINVDDDTPTASVTAGPDALVTLTTDDADTIGSNSDSAVTLADFSGVFTGTTSSAGADGAGAGTTGGYTLAVTAQASGLKSHGSNINLFVVDGTVVGTTAGTAPALLTDASIVFTVSVSNTGIVTLTQMQQIDHADEAPGATGFPFNDQLASMADGLVTLTRSLTVIDKDGDSVTSSATVQIGANLRFTDDGPAISGVRGNGSVTLDETNGAEPVSAGAPIVVTSADPMISVAAANYGADGQGPDPVYGLSLLGGVDSLASGLATAAGDHPITLVQIDSDTIQGQYTDGGTQVAFIIQMNANGTITVTQNTALEHLVDGPPGPAHDDSLSLVTVIGETVTSLVNATVTIEDFDGDTASASVPIGDAIVFKDDGPSVNVTKGSDAEIFLITADEGTEGPGSTSDTTAAAFDGAFSLGSSNGGGDGTASVPLLTYQLATAGGASGLTSHGNAINLFMVGSTVVGATGTQPADLNDPDIVFTVSVNGSGVVTLTQFQQIDHPDEAPGATDSPFNDQSTGISLINDALITLTASATITDNDGDTASDSETINIAANLRFTDDGPTISGATLNSSVLLDETDGSEPVSAGAPIVVTSADPMISPSAVDYGADGQGPDPVYGLSLLGGVDSLASGLATAAGDHPITLVLIDSDTIQGQYTDGGTQVAFIIQMNANGTITVTQNTALEHLVDGPPGPAHDDALDLINDSLQNLVNATVTIEDFDGDTASASVPIGGAIVFEDDGPSINVTKGSDAEIFLITADEGTEGPGSTSDSTSAAFDGAFAIGSSSGGGDGTASAPLLTYQLATAGGASGLTSHNVAINLFMVGSTVVGATGTQPADLSDPDIVFTVSVNGSGVVTLTQFQQIDHPDEAPGATGSPFNDQSTGISLINDALITLTASATITDNDGDTASDSETINIGANLRFTDDGPVATSPAVNSSVTLDETSGAEPVSSGAPIQGTSALAMITATVDYGADGKGPDPVYGLSLFGGGPVGSTVASGLATAVGDLPITLTLTSSTLITGSYNAGANTAFTIQMNANGTITVTLFTALEHETDGPPGPAHDDSLDLINAQLQNLVNATVTYEDFDGDTATATVGIGGAIIFKDDGPTAQDEPQGSVPENGLATGTFDFNGGGDGGSVTHLNGTLLTFGGDGWSQWINVEDGRIRAQADGDYQFEPDGSASGVTSGTYTVTDNDGDTVVANWSFDITDVGSPTAGSSNASVDDDGLTGPPAGNPAGGALEGDINANLGEVAPTNSSEAIFHGDLNAEFGPDGAGTISFAAMAAPGVFRMVGTERVHFTWDAGTLTLTAVVDATVDGVTAQARAGTELFEVVLDGSLNGNYTLTLLDNVLHASGGQEASAPTVSLSFNITDSDNSPVGGANGTLIVTFNDDMPTVTPVLSGTAAATVDESLPVAAAVIDTLTVTKGDDGAFSGGLAIGGGSTAGSVLTPNANFGADGAAASGSVVYALSVINAASGLTTTEGRPITLELLSNGVVVGRVSGGTFDGQAAFAIQIDATSGAITVEQYLSLDHPTNPDANESITMDANTLGATVTVKDGDNDSVTSNAIDISTKINFFDDGPTLGTVQNGTANNDPTAPHSFGSLNFVSGADDPGSALTIGATLTGIKSGGHTLVTNQVGNVLTAYQSLDNTGPYNAAEDTVVVFTLTINPTGGPNGGTWDFDLQQALDPSVTDTPIGGASAFGAGPTGFQILTGGVGPQDLAVISGYNTDTTPATGPGNDGDPVFNFNNWFNNGVLSASDITSTGINGSTAGWGVTNQNFENTNELMFFDFGSQPTSDPDGAGGAFVPPVQGPDVAGDPPEVQMPNISFATFDFINYKAGDDIAYVVHFVNPDGTSAGFTSGFIPAVHLDGSSNDPSTNWTINAPAGKFIGDVQFYSGANNDPPTFSEQDLAPGKIDLVSVGVTTSNLNVNLGFSLTMQDSDGDPTVSRDFTINIQPSNTQSAATPVALDTNGDGVVSFLGADSGVLYDYNGDGIAEATAWVGGGDSILVRDANHNGLVDNASEFVFGGNGQTDLEALHAQYGAQLDASDADFTMFAVWNDANSNGAVDANELQSLAEAGITSIGLVSDGIGYATAGGDVQVSGSSTYANADGSTGVVADAAFLNKAAAAQTNQEVERIAANSNSVTLAAAVAAAGLAASSGAAAQVPVFDAGDHFATNMVTGKFALADAGGMEFVGSRFSAFNGHEGGFDVGVMQMASTSPTAIMASHIGELTTALAIANGPTALLDATDFSTMLQVPTMSTAMNVASLNVESLMPQAAGVAVQTNQVVEQIIADALQGGGAAHDINALLNALPGSGQGLGEIAGLGHLSTPGGEGVPTWDMGHAGVFTFDAASIITTEAMVLHHDAVQPAANG